jgi:hypothetical protein
VIPNPTPCNNDFVLMGEMANKASEVTAADYVAMRKRGFRASSSVEVASIAEATAELHRCLDRGHVEQATFLQLFMTQIRATGGVDTEVTDSVISAAHAQLNRLAGRRLRKPKRAGVRRIMKRYEIRPVLGTYLLYGD